MTNDPIDFSALDPSGNATRWDNLLHSVAARAVKAAKTQRDTSITELLVHWSRPSLVAASVAAMVTCLGALQSLNKQSSATLVHQESPSSQLARWAESYSPQSTLQILQAFEGVQ